MVEHRHCTPTDGKGCVHMRLRPLKHLLKLIPIGHLLKGQMLNWRAGDDQAIKFFTACFDVLEGTIKAAHMFCRGVFGMMFAHPDQR